MSIADSPTDGNAPARSGPAAASSLLTPQESVLALIDHQGLMLMGAGSHDRQRLVNNVTGLAKSARAFGVPVVLTTNTAKTFSGPMLPEIRAVFPDQEVIDRTAINAWEDGAFVRAIEATGRRKLMIAGLWTEVCVAYPALSALEAGYQVYVVADACAGVDIQTHDTAIQRVVQGGAIPVTWLDVLFEFQRDWSRQEAYDAVVQIILQHTGGLGEGINFLFGMTSPVATN
jgi:nicotinamidase-related amidase